MTQSERAKHGEVVIDNDGSSLLDDSNVLTTLRIDEVPRHPSGPGSDLSHRRLESTKRPRKQTVPQSTRGHVALPLQISSELRAYLILSVGPERSRGEFE